MSAQLPPIPAATEQEERGGLAEIYSVLLVHLQGMDGLLLLGENFVLSAYYAECLKLFSILNLMEDCVNSGPSQTF